MVWFFRDFLDGLLYLVVSFFSLIFIMAILGFMMERKQLEKEEKNRMVVLNNKNVAPDYNVGSYEESRKQAVQGNISGIPIQDSKNVIPESVVSRQEEESSRTENVNSSIPEILDLNLVDDNK